MEGGAYNEIHDGVEVRGELIAVGLQQAERRLVDDDLNQFIHQAQSREVRVEGRQAQPQPLLCTVSSIFILEAS